MAALDYMTQVRPSKQTLEMIAALPRGERRQVLIDVNDRDGLLEWFEEQEPTTPNLPELNGETAKIRELIIGGADDGHMLLGP